MPAISGPSEPLRPQVTPVSPVPRLEVFLSHSVDDRDQVMLVQRQIEALGIDVYLAEHNPKPGTSIAAKIDEAIRCSHAVVVLITTTSINSAYVQQEVGLARAYGKPIIPIVEKGVDKSRLGMLGEVEYLELDLSQPAEALAKVSASLQPLVLAQVSAVNVSLTVAQTTPRADNELLLVGLGLLLGLLIASWAFSQPGAAGTV